jgi:hypothetical protein
MARINRLYNTKNAVPFWITLFQADSWNQLTKKLLQLTAIILLIVAIGWRSVSYAINTKEWVQSPLNYVERSQPCPPVPYHTDPSHWWNTKICITTLTDAAKADLWQRLVRTRNFGNLLSITWPNKQNYAEKHGYDLFDESKSLDTSRPPSWSKIKAVQRLLTEEQCDWVFWLDADTVIMNSDIRIEEFLPVDGPDFIVTPEKRNHINAGAWLIRNTPWAHEFLNTWWSMESYVRAKGLGVSGDNDALNAFRVAQTPAYLDEHFAIVPRCTFNSVASWLTPAEEKEFRTTKKKVQDQEYYNSPMRYHKGDFVAHVAGKSNKIQTCALLVEDAS